MREEPTRFDDQAAGSLLGAQGERNLFVSRIEAAEASGRLDARDHFLLAFVERSGGSYRLGQHLVDLMDGIFSPSPRARFTMQRRRRASAGWWRSPRTR